MELAGMVSADQVRSEKIPRLGRELLDAHRNLRDHAGLMARALDQVSLNCSVPAVRLPILKQGSLVVCVTGLGGIVACDIPVWALGGTTLTNGPIGLLGVRVEPADLVVAERLRGHGGAIHRCGRGPQAALKSTLRQQLRDMIPDRRGEGR